VQGEQFGKRSEWFAGAGGAAGTENASSATAFSVDGAARARPEATGSVLSANSASTAVFVGGAGAASSATEEADAGSGANVGCAETVAALSVGGAGG
jgi:hypothetical protein